MLGHFSTDIVLIFAGQLGVDLVPSQLLSISPRYRKVVVSSVIKLPHEGDGVKICKLHLIMARVR